MRADVPPSALTVAVQPRSPQDKVVERPGRDRLPGACGVLFDTGSQVRLTADARQRVALLRLDGRLHGRGRDVHRHDGRREDGSAAFATSTFLLSLVVNGKGA